MESVRLPATFSVDGSNEAVQFGNLKSLLPSMFMIQTFAVLYFGVERLKRTFSYYSCSGTNEKPCMCYNVSFWRGLVFILASFSMTIHLAIRFL